MAVGANGCIPHASLDRFPVDALVELPGNFLVALPAGLRHFPMIHVGTRIASRVNIVAAVATTTVRRLLVARSHRAAVNALFVRLNGMSDGNLVSRQKSGIAVAFCASIRQVLARHCGVRLARGLHGMNGAMARGAIGSIGVAILCRLTVDAPREGFHFVRMTFRAFGGNECGSGSQFMHAAMARGTRSFTQNRVHAPGECLHFIFVARGALYFGDFSGVRKIFNAGMAIGTAQNRMRAGRVFRRIDVDVLACVRLHTRLPMARQTSLVSGRSR